MSRKIRYVDLGKVTPEIFSSMWEVDQVLNITSSTIFKWKADRSLCHFWQGPHYADYDFLNRKDIWYYDNTDISAVMTSSVLSDVTLMRCWEASSTLIIKELMDYPDWSDPSETVLRHETSLPPDYVTSSIDDWNPEIENLYTEKGYDISYYTEDEYLTNWILVNPMKGEGVETVNTMHSKLCDILTEKNIIVTSSGNDTFYQHPQDNTNTWKKFAGSITRPSWNDMYYVDFGVTWNFDKTLANRVRAVATGSNILIKKFEAVDAGENIAGLYALTSSIDLDRDTLETDLENRMFNFLQVTKSISSLTTEESQSLWTRGHQRLNDTNWQYYGDNSAYTASLESRLIMGH